jgi:hypothetical protein
LAEISNRQPFIDDYRQERVAHEPPSPAEAGFSGCAPSIRELIESAVPIATRLIGAPDEDRLDPLAQVESRFAKAASGGDISSLEKSAHHAKSAVVG